MKVLSEHFEPPPSQILAHRFHICEREDATSVTAYVATLRRLARTCQFSAEVLEEMLRDRLVCGIRNPRLQSRLLSEPGITFNAALAIAQAFESAVAKAIELNLGSPVSAERADLRPVPRLKQRQRQRQSTESTACGGNA